MAGINTITGASISSEFRYSATNNQTGSAYTGISSGGDCRKSYAFGTAAANSASGGGDEVFSFQQTIAGGGSATIDLYALTNVLSQTAVALARIKAIQVRLLSTADDSTITSPAASAVCVTNNGPAVPTPLDFQAGGSGFTITLTVVAGAVTGVAIGAAGSGYLPSTTFLCSPQQAGGSGCVFLAGTNASGVVTSATFVAGNGGSGYTAATVPAIAIGQRTINGGGAAPYFDVLAAGFLAVSSTSRNFKVYNLDSLNTATIEIDVFGATS